MRKTHYRAGEDTLCVGLHQLKWRNPAALTDDRDTVTCVPCIQILRQLSDVDWELNDIADGRMPNP